MSEIPPTHPAFALMTSRLADVIVELFAAYDIPVQRSWGTSAATMPAEIACAATIGYVGERVRGALTILANETTVHSWLGSSGIGEWELGDVLGEYANMLLGRLKTRLLPDGFPILIATPTSTTGCGIRLSMPPGLSTWLVFDGPDWKVGVRLDATFEQNFALQCTAGWAPPIEAGEAILF